MWIAKVKRTFWWLVYAKWSPSCGMEKGEGCQSEGMDRNMMQTWQRYSQAVLSLALTMLHLLQNLVFLMPMMQELLRTPWRKQKTRPKVVKFSPGLMFLDPIDSYTFYGLGSIMQNSSLFFSLMAILQMQTHALFVIQVLILFLIWFFFEFLIAIISIAIFM